MIVTFILTVILTIVAAILSPLPSITELPFGMDSFVQSAGGDVRGFVDVFWPLQPVFTAFILYCSVLLGLLIVRFFIGSHAPDA